jgi:hypothetical protein
MAGRPGCKWPARSRPSRSRIGTKTRVIAINSEPNTPIFAIAEVGAVADASTLLPLPGTAIEALAARAQV